MKTTLHLILPLAILTATLPALAQESHAEWQTLFNGSSLDGWKQAGPGSFVLEEDGTMRSSGGMGLFYWAEDSFRDFELALEWKVGKHTANSGVFVRFPKTDDPWVAVNEGYEIQIDNSRDRDHVTGSLYTFSAPFRVDVAKTDDWNSYRIRVSGQRYEVWLNDEKINDFFGDRSREGYIGLQNHDDSSKVWFRNVRIRKLREPGAMSLAEEFAVNDEREDIRVLMVTATHGFRHSQAIDAQKKLMAALSTTTEFRVDVTEDLADLNPVTLAQYDLLFLANATLRTNKPRVLSTTVWAPGDFANYDITLHIPDNEFKGKVALSGDLSSLTGMITFALFPEPSPLTSAVVTGDSLIFTWEAGAMGTMQVAAELVGDSLAGSILLGSMQMPVTGALRTMPATTLSTSWDVKVSTPQGTMDMVLTLIGTDAGEVESPEGLVPLEDVQLDGETFTFRFHIDQAGMVDGTATTSGDDITGTLSVGSVEFGFEGSLKIDDQEEDDEAESPHITIEQQAAVVEFLSAGKGLAIAHSGLDALYGWDEYREMAGGGLFVSHPWTQSVRITVDDPDNPAVNHFGDGFWIHDEIYVLDENPRWNARVLLSLDTESVALQEDVSGVERNDYPISWIDTYESGKVFVTKLGHFGDVWTTPSFVQHVLQGMRIAAGRLDADFSGRRIKETIAEGVWPDDLAVDEHGNVWIAELRGKIHRYDAESGEVHQIAHIETTDPTNIEHGMYGIEVDPDFYDGAPYVYLYYAEPASFINTLSRFTYRDGILERDSEHVLLRVPTEPTCCHQAGDIEWATDGTLLLSTGDTGMSEVRPGWEMTDKQIAAFLALHDLKDYHWSRLVDSERSAQNLQDLRGKVLRINRDGSIPHDNPFFGEPGVRWEIYAYGLRNPYRFTVDHDTNALLIGVVGPDGAFDYDEYNIAARGGENFGWPRSLGRLFYNEWKPDMIPSFVPPIWEYTYATGSRSATVGPIYRHDGDEAFPDFLQNKVLVFDWSRRWIKYADLVSGEFTSDTEKDVRTTPPSIVLPAKRLANIRTFDTLRGTSPISIDLGPDGSIVVAEFDGFWDAGPNSKVTRYRWVYDE